MRPSSRRSGPRRGAARCALRRRDPVQAEKLSFTQPIVGAALEDGLPLGRRAEHLQAAGLLEEDEAPPDVVAAQSWGPANPAANG